MLKLFNSLSRQKEAFKPITPNEVSLYVCGITVYDYCHIGHARTAVAFDVLARYFLYSGYSVNFVRNITDIDDKIIKRAAENGETCDALTARFIQAMHHDYEQLGLLPPNHEPKATETIGQIIAMIERLITQKSAYVTDNGDVYFDTNSFDEYGLLAQQDLDSLQVGARIEQNDVKRAPLDFVLWKSAKPGEPVWESPWGPGRPGWHIECSAMSTHFLGDTIDIHGGGNDLKFPHHENERAQSEACTGQHFVNYWMHVGFVQVDNEKMSKSLDNFFTIREVLAQYAPEVVRYFLVASHYRSPVNFSEVALDNARSSLETFYTALRGLDLTDQSVSVDTSSYEAEFKTALDDDLNTPLALSVMFELAKQINIEKQKGELSTANVLGALLKQFGAVLGICQQPADSFLQDGVSDFEQNQIEKIIAERNQARIDKNWVRADELRNTLLAMGIEIEDGQGNTNWRKSGK